jgi:hypothetical protein
MTKKQDFLRDDQSRSKHPERQVVGSKPPGSPAARWGAEVDQQKAGAGKVANDHNSQGNQAPTQTHQARRTPESRHDQQAMGAGPQNQTSARKGGGGAGRTPRGAG